MIDLPFNLNTFLYLALMIFVGMGFGRLAKLCKLPNVTGYLVGGLVLGPSVLGLVPADALAGMDLLSDLALGFIAFSIGNEFKLSYFKRVGATPIVIAVLESLLAVVAVAGGLMLAGFEVSFALVLGSIAAATAPAATIMVIKQYKAKGPMTETLLSVVAIDDATALIFFSLCVAVAGAMNGKAGSLSQSLLSPLVEIGGAILLGFALGLLFLLPLRWFKKDGNRLALIFGFVLAGVGLANLLNVSALLLCMAMGAALANFSKDVDHILKLTDGVTPPLFLLFFVTSGAELQLGVLPSIGVAGVLYVTLRVVGKLGGAGLGGVLCKAEPSIKKYLGLALVPQAGVAIGLSLAATRVVPEYGSQIRAIILCATLIYEMVGPALSKLSLKKAGEIKE
ncbi:MAG: cation:proton antiporter [Clostridia bacterium]|nr:cation:proton antiporter [Clostridia bacterium]